MTRSMVDALAELCSPFLKGDNSTFIAAIGGGGEGERHRGRGRGEGGGEGERGAERSIYIVT